MPARTALAPSTVDATARDAARWFTRVAGTSADDPVRARFEAWLLTSPRHAEEYARYAELWDDFESAPRLEKLTQALETKRAAETMQRERQRQHRRALLHGVALGLAALGGTGVFGWRLWSEHRAAPLLVLSRSTGRGQALEQTLPDGSRFVVAPESTLRVRYFRDRREVALDRGEAIFDVASDALRPFIVSCAQARVAVLGTHFVVSRLPDDGVRVSVIEGWVRVGRAAGAADAGTLILAAGDVAEVDTSAHGPQRVDRAAADAVSWRQGTFVFDADGLPEVVQRLSRHAPRPIELASPSAPGARITAVVQLRDIEAFVRSLPTIAPVRVRDDGGSLHIEALRLGETAR